MKRYYTVDYSELEYSNGNHQAFHLDFHLICYRVRGFVKADAEVRGFIFV